MHVSFEWIALIFRRVLQFASPDATDWYILSILIAFAGVEKIAGKLLNYCIVNFMKTDEFY